MTPRTKTERRFADMAGKLPPLTEARKAWARDLFPAQALYYSRRGNNCEFWCQCCGHVEPTLGTWILADYAADTWECPECGAECEIIASYNARNTPGIRYDRPVTSRYVTLLTTHEGMQVFRTYDVRRTVRRDAPTEFSYNEIFQNWILPDGREVITTRHYTRGFNFFNWEYGSAWGIGRHNAHCTGYYGFDDVYDLDGNWFFPRPQVAPVLRRNGFSVKALREKYLDPAEYSRRLLKDNTFEEVVKLGYTAVAVDVLRRNRRLENYIHSLRICARNGYRIKHPDLWFDLIDNLAELGLDTRSPHYVCPDNLRAAHGRMFRRVERQRDRIEREERRREAVKQEAAYAEMRAAFLGIAFTDGEIRVAVLQSVHEVMLEGAALHHCVFDNGYYKHKDSLLLSARDARGKRLETIEIDLRKFRILQARGLQNNPSKAHKRIVDLCNANMDLIRRAAAKTA